MWSYTFQLYYVAYQKPIRKLHKALRPIWHKCFTSRVTFWFFAPLTHGVIWSLGLNILFGFQKFIVQVLLNKFRQKVLWNQAFTFTAYLYRFNLHDAARLKVGDLFALAKRMSSQPHKHSRTFVSKTISPKYDCQWHVVAFYRAISSIGAASARTLLTTAMINNG